MKKVLFIIDKIELKYFEFNKLVTNFWIIKELLERGEEVYITTIPQLYLHGKVAYSKCYHAYYEKEDIFYNKQIFDKEIDSFDVVMFRPDPPVDLDYINATYIFDFVTKPKVINSPFFLIEYVKLHASRFLLVLIVHSISYDSFPFFIKLIITCPESDGFIMRFGIYRLLIWLIVLPYRPTKIEFVNKLDLPDPLLEIPSELASS